MSISILYGMVYSAGIEQRTGFESYQLCAELMDVGGELARTWYPEIDSVVYSSATIAVGEEFEHFDHQVGFDTLRPDQYHDLRLNSSYDFANQMSVLVTKNMPEPNDPAYMNELVKLLVDVHLAMDGSVLTLFTNRREMETAFELVAPVCEQHGLMLLCQMKGNNVRQLRERFIAEPSSSLFALKSFWEGFDAAGDPLRCVVIPKLPFSRPTEPVALERDAREKNAWSRYSLPEAVLTMKQAAGRLIRSSTDTGCLVLADQRLTTKRYGRVFLRALPKKDYELVHTTQMAQALRAWREHSER